MSLRVRLIGIEKPYHGITTIHSSTVLGPCHLSHIIPNKHLTALFPFGCGINFDFIGFKQVAIRPDKHIQASLNGKEMVASESYLVTPGDVKILGIGDVPFKVELFQSYF